MPEEALQELKTKVEHALHSHTQVVVVIAGASASGKSTFAQKLAESLPYEATVLGTDHYYRGKQDMEKHQITSFDDPRALDSSLFQEHVRSLMEGGSIQKVKYDFQTSDIMDAAHPENYMTIHPTPVLIVEGIFNLRPEFLPHIVPNVQTITVAVYAPEEELILRRMKRDSLSNRKSHTPAKVLLSLQEEVLPAYRKYIVPSLQEAQVHVYNP